MSACIAFPSPLSSRPACLHPPRRPTCPVPRQLLAFLPACIPARTPVLLPSLPSRLPCLPSLPADRPARVAAYLAQRLAVVPALSDYLPDLLAFPPILSCVPAFLARAFLPASAPACLSCPLAFPALPTSYLPSACPTCLPPSPATDLSACTACPARLLSSLPRTSASPAFPACLPNCPARPPAYLSPRLAVSPAPSVCLPSLIPFPPVPACLTSCPTPASHPG